MRRATSRMCDVKPKASISSSTAGRDPKPADAGRLRNAAMGPSAVAIVTSASSVCMLGTYAVAPAPATGRSAPPAEQDQARDQEDEPEREQDRGRLERRLH